MSEIEGNLRGRIEAVLFVAGDAVLMKDLAAALKVSNNELKQALESIKTDYDAHQCGFSLRIYQEHVQLTSRSIYAQDIVHMLQPIQKQSLSQAVMETLAVIAYKQPVTKAEVEAVRGVKCDYSVQVLTNKGLIRELGRKDAIGRPILYGTTDAFLQHFGIESLKELPALPEPASATEDHDSDVADI